VKGLEHGKPESDRELVAYMRDGDRKAWSEFVNRYQNLVFYYARQWMRAAIQASGEKPLKIISKNYDEDYWHNDAFAWILEEFAMRKGLWQHFLEKTGKYESLEHFLRVVLRPYHALHIDYIRSHYARRKALPSIFEFSANAREVFKMIRAEKSDDEIAKKLKLPAGEVRTIRKTLSEKLFDAVQLPGKLQKGTMQEKNVYDLLKSNMPELQIATELGLSLEDVKKHRDRIIQNLIKDRQLPRALLRCTKEEQAAFILLKFAIPENQIIQELELTADELQEIRAEIEKALFKGNQEDLSLERVEMVDDPADDAPITPEVRPLLKEAVQFFARAWNKLPREDRLLLRLFYVEDLSSGEILKAYQTIDKEMLAEKSIQKANSKNVDKVLENSKARLWRLLQQEYPDWQLATPDSDVLKTFFKYWEQQRNGKEQIH
jgi:DNA-directed RNA polymerase specialized sigma subunit